MTVIHMVNDMSHGYASRQHHIDKVDGLIQCMPIHYMPKYNVCQRLKCKLITLMEVAVTITLEWTRHKILECLIPNPTIQKSDPIQQSNPAIKILHFFSMPETKNMI